MKTWNDGLLRFLCAVLALGVFPSEAGTTKWTGRGTSWHDPASWDNGVPQKDDHAVFETDATLDDSFVLDGRLTISVSNSQTLVLNGVISGTGTLVFGTANNNNNVNAATDTGTVRINGANTFAGDMVVSNGYVYLNHDTAGGDPAAGRVHVCAWNKKTKLYLTNVNLAKALYVQNKNDTAVGWSPFVYFDGVNTVRTLTNSGNARLSVAGTTYWTGGTGTGSLSSLFIVAPQNNAQFVIKDTPVKMMPYQATASGEVVFACEGNEINIGNYYYYCQVRCDVNNAFTEKSTLCFSEGVQSRFNLNGTTQCIAQIKMKISGNNPGVITSEAGGCLKVVGDCDSSISNIVSGAVSFVCALPQGRTASFFNTNTSTGDLVCESGKIVIGSESCWVGNVYVHGGGAVEVKRIDALSEKAEIHMADGALLMLPEGEIAVDKLFLDDTRLMPGVYTASGADGTTKLGVLSGTGRLRVKADVREPQQAVWTGAGTDDKMTTAENWQGSRVPSLDDGSLLATFPENGHSVTLEGDVMSRGMLFTSETAGGTVEMKAAEGGGLFLFDSLFSVLSENRVGKTVVCDVPVYLQGPCAVDVSKNAIVRFREGVFSSGNGTFVKHGLGEAYIVALSNQCSVAVSNGACSVAYGDIGHLAVAVTNESRNTKLFLDECVVNKELVCWNTPDCCVSFVSGSATRATTNIINGPISGQGNCRLRVGGIAGSKLFIRGGFVQNGVNYFIPSGIGTNESEVIVEEVPFNKAPHMVYTDGNTVTLTLRVPGNRVSTGEWKVNNRVRCEVDYAIAETEDVMFFKEGYGVVDLNGTAQRVRAMRTTSRDAPGRVTDDSAEGGGVVTYTLSSGGRLSPMFTGQASLVLAGGLALTNIFENTTTGDLTLTSGSLCFEGTSSWRNGGAVTVTGGKISLCASDVFTRKTDLYLGDQGTLELAAGTRQKMKFLYMPDDEGVWRKCALGTYGSAQSAAEHRLSCFTGEGLIEIAGDGKGTALFIR